MNGTLGAPERSHVAQFLAGSVGSLSGTVDPELEDRIFQSMWGTSEGMPGEIPWIDDAVKAPAVKPVLSLSHDVDFVTSQQQGRKLLRRLQLAIAGHGSLRVGLGKAAGSLIRLLMEWPSRERYGDLVEWLRLEDRFGFRSTFFFLPLPDHHGHVHDGDYRFSDRICFDGRDLRVEEVMRELVRAGWEVGLHGSYESARRPGLLAQQKTQLEACLGHEVVAVRQHFLQFRHDLTPRLQAAAGFRVDSTDGRNDGLGPRRGTTRPYQAWDLEQRLPLDLMVVPMSAMDTALMAEVAQGRSWGAVQERTLAAFDHSARNGGVFCANWHPHYWPLGDVREVYQSLLEHAKGAGASGRCLGSFAAGPT